MPFVTNGRLEDFLDEDAPARACREIADDAGDAMETYTKRNTPVETRFLRDSVHRTPVEHVDPVTFRVRVRTEDPKGPHVEWRTKAHWITPRKPGGTLSWIGRGGRRRFAKRVWHPGSEGAHMFSLGALKTEAELGRIAGPAVARFARDLVRDRRL